MEKNIAQVTYWLGIACLIVALVWRALNALGLWVPMQVSQGQTVYYMSFYKGSLLFFVAAIATTCYAWFKAQEA
jgi:hypothetical protein